MALRTSPILLATVLSILLLGAAALWDERRESAATLDDFASEQSALAREAAAALEPHLPPPDATSDAELVGVLRRAIGALEEPGGVVALVQRPYGSASGLVTTRGTMVRSEVLESALAGGARSVHLARDDAAALGLPPRLAMAGLAAVGRGSPPRWGVAVVATALRIRDRESRSTWRLVLGFALTSALIGGFGLLAQRKHEKELELARSLAIAEARQLRDERLVRADKLATLGALATGIAHEVSTPLGVIVGRAEQLLPKVASDERATHSVKAITEQAERITHVVRAFLRLARGGAPSLARVYPSGLVGAAVELVEHRFSKAGVNLTSNLDPALPRIACDAKLIEQALVNLLLNACDACAHGGHVELAVRSDGERVAFVVTDDGEGITPGIAARATEPFFTTKSEVEGTGLGLAIVNEIVKHHHGELVLSPRPNGRGTRASVELAAVRENDHA